MTSKGDEADLLNYGNERLVYVFTHAIFSIA
jgi:hypothetical protein